MEEKIEELKVEIDSIKALLATEIEDIKKMLFFVNEGILENRAILRAALQEIEAIKFKHIKPNYEKTKLVVQNQEKVETDIDTIFNNLKSRAKIKMVNNKANI